MGYALVPKGNEANASRLLVWLDLVLGAICQQSASKIGVDTGDLISYDILRNPQWRPQIMTMFAGEEGVTYFRAASIKAGLKLLKVGIKPGRAWTKTNALKAAAGITGKRGYRKIDIDLAIADLDHWLKERQLPVV